MSDEIVNNLKKPSAWFRVLFMAGFVVALYVAGVILLVLMLAQIVFSLLTGADNTNLRRLGAGLARYVSQILAFLTYNSDQKPFPFLPFPEAPAGSADGDDDSDDDDNNLDQSRSDYSEPAAASDSESDDVPKPRSVRRKKTTDPEAPQTDE